MHDAQGALINRSTARLVVMEPTSYAAETLSWPVDTRLRNVQSLVYDDERKTLFMVVAEWFGPERMDELIEAKTGQILTTRVSVPQAGWP